MPGAVLLLIAPNAPVAGALPGPLDGPCTAAAAAGLDPAAGPPKWKTGIAVAAGPAVAAAVEGTAVALVPVALRSFVVDPKPKPVAGAAPNVKVLGIAAAPAGCAAAAAGAGGASKVKPNPAGLLDGAVASTAEGAVLVLAAPYPAAGLSDGAKLKLTGAAAAANAAAAVAEGRSC